MPFPFTVQAMGTFRRLLTVGAATALLLAGCNEQEPKSLPAVQPQSPRASAEVDQAPLVLAAFNDYKAAALAADGPAAAALLASTVDDFYDQARGFALTATDAELRTQPVTTQVTALFMRGSLEPELLRTADPDQLVAAAVDAGLVGEQGVEQVQIGEVTVTGDRATAPALVDGQAGPFNFEFVREQGRWTLDLLPLLQQGSAVFEQVATQQGVTVDQLIDRTLVQKYGADKAARLRMPIGR